MQRILGAALLMAGCIGFSYVYCERMRQRITTLQDMERILQLMTGRVKERRIPLPEICRELMCHAPMPFAYGYEEIIREYERMEGRDFTEIYREKMEMLLKDCNLELPEKECFAEIAELFRSGSDEVLFGQLRESLLRLSESRRRAEEECQKKQGLAVKLGAMSGILLILIFF